jgi:hypothetical protein
VLHQSIPYSVAVNRVEQEDRFRRSPSEEPIPAVALIATGHSSDSLAALINGKWVILRVPYPNGLEALRKLPTFRRKRYFAAHSSLKKVSIGHSQCAVSNEPYHQCLGRPHYYR